jgi:micrococcal nuclease
MLKNGIFLIALLLLLYTLFSLDHLSPSRATPDFSARSSQSETALVARVDEDARMRIAATLVKVVDGDTIAVLVEGEEEVVRLIGINTPETVDPRRPVECFGNEASLRTRALLGGGNVVLEFDASQDRRDRYGRLLAYVFLPDGTLVNEVLVSEGYAYEYTYNLPYIYQNAFRAAERAAREEERGLWAPNMCT